MGASNLGFEETPEGLFIPYPKKSQTGQWSCIIIVLLRDAMQKVWSVSLLFRIQTAAAAVRPKARKPRERPGKAK